MTIPTFKLSEDSQTEGYAIDTNSILRIQSVLFDQHVLEFPAFLTDMSQTFTSTWNSYEFVCNFRELSKTIAGIKLSSQEQFKDLAQLNQNGK